MPCRWSRRYCGAVDADVNALIVDAVLPTPSSSPEVDSWRKVRFQNIRSLRKHTKCILLLMALLQALKTGPVQMVYAGRDGFPAPGEQDYGISYTVGYLLSYIYVCIFMIIYIPLFSWWVPVSKSDPEHPDFSRKLADFLKQLNMILLPISIGVSVISYLVSVAQVFIYVDSRPVNSLRFPKNNRKNWTVRLMLLCGILASLSFGYGAFQVLEITELARVKPAEYLIIVVPIQINLGLLLGSKMQMRMEKRVAMKKVVQRLEASAAMVIDEKAPLMQV